MKYLLYSLLLITFTGCQQSATTQQKADKADQNQVDSAILISCEGVGEIKMSVSHDELEKQVGANELTPHENTVYGNFTTVWENTPKAVNVYWKEKTPPYKTVNYLEVVDPVSVYRTKDSLRVGLNLRDMVRMNNNMPLTFRNFYAEERSGLITSFNNGAIGQNNPCLTGVLEWSSQENVYKDQYEEFKKQEIVESHEKILQRIDVNLSAIRVLNKQ